MKVKNILLAVEAIFAYVWHRKCYRILIVAGCIKA